MSRFSAVTLDLSRFPAPLAVVGVDFETIMEERIARLEVIFQERGIPYDVGSLESDKAIVIEESDAFRELLALTSINDAVKAGLIAFAVGADLEHLAAFYGLTRRVIVPATSTAPDVLESDDELRRRALLAPEAFATSGTYGGYVFHALTADTSVVNADVWSPGPGQVTVALQAREGLATADADVVAAVRAHLHRPDIKPLTDMVSVQSVSTHEYSIDVIVYVQPGPDPAAVRSAVEQSLAALAVRLRLPARDVPLSAVIAAASVGPVDRVVVAQPAADVVMGNGELAVCAGITVRVETHDG